MAYMEWARELEFGIPVIDSQHKRIVDFMNELEEARLSGNIKIIQHVIEDLLNYTVTHFDFEEELQEKAGYPYIKAHRRIHENFRKKITSFRDRSSKGENIAHELMDLLNGWLVSHIKSEDLDYVDSVKMILTREDHDMAGWMSATLKKFFG
jgi:hemerythrin